MDYGRLCTWCARGCETQRDCVSFDYKALGRLNLRHQNWFLESRFQSHIRARSCDRDECGVYSEVRVRLCKEATVSSLLLFNSRLCRRSLLSERCKQDETERMPFDVEVSEIRRLRPSPPLLESGSEPAEHYSLEQLPAVHNHAQPSSLQEALAEKSPVRKHKQHAIRCRGLGLALWLEDSGLLLCCCLRLCNLP